jgi:excisionase family DNA binding protein
MGVFEQQQAEIAEVKALLSELLARTQPQLLEGAVGLDKAAELLGNLSRRKVEELISHKRIAHVKIDKRTVVRREEIDRFLRENEVRVEKRG